jgi:hypothetical protein
LRFGLGGASVTGMGIVDDLLAQPGLYLGINRGIDSGTSSAARMEVTPLPGRGGVFLDYETFEPAKPDQLRPHAEHTVIARTHGGGAVLVSGHLHADSAMILRETDPGVFELGSEASAFPVKIVISMPEPGHLTHAWWYARPGDVPTERDVADLKLTS